MSTPDGQSPFARALSDLLAEARQRLETDETTPSEWVTTPEILVQKQHMFLPVSCCFLTDSTGVNHCEHPPTPRPLWHRRLRWRTQDRWRALRMRVGSWIAGVDLDDRDDDW